MSSSSSNMKILGFLLLTLCSPSVPTANAWQIKNPSNFRRAPSSSSSSLHLSSRPADDLFTPPQVSKPQSSRRSRQDAGIIQNSFENDMLQNDITTTVADEYLATSSNSITTTTTSLENSPQNEKDKFTPFQQGVRRLVGLGILGYMVNPEPGDRLIESIYSVIYNWDLASTPLFEAKVAVMGFFCPIVAFSSLHLLLGEKATKASRFDGQLPTRPFEWAEFENWNLSFNPTVAYLGSIWIYHQFVHAHAALPEMAPTLGVFAVELVFGVWLYDLVFFPIHYLMHHSKWGKLRKVHGYHHRVSSHSLNALETVQHSYMDGFLQVAVNVFVQQISPFGGFGHKHFLSRLAHNLVVTYLLTEAHSGYDLPWMSHRIFPEILGGSPRHEGHHHDGRVYYQQYFKYLDDFFGFTKEEDVVDAQPMEKQVLQEQDAPSAGLIVAAIEEESKVSA